MYDKWPYVAPKPGTLFFITSARRAYGMGAGHPVGWQLFADGHTVAIIADLPSEPGMIETAVHPSAPGAGTPIVVAYDPATVEVFDVRSR